MLYSCTAEEEEIRDRIALSVEKEADMLVGMGFRFSEPFTAAAPEHPDHRFLLIDAEDIPSDQAPANLPVINFRPEEGSYMAGILAALEAEDRTAGFIGGMDIPVIEPFHQGYVSGLEFAGGSPADVPTRYLGSFQDREAAYESAQEMFDSGVGVIYQAAGLAGDGVFRAARERGTWAIGEDFDQGLAFSHADDPEKRRVAPAILTSVLKKYDYAVYDAGARFLREGTLPSGVFSMGIAEGGVDLAVNPYNSSHIMPRQPALQEARRQVISGRVSFNRETAPSWSAPSAPGAPPAAPVDRILALGIIETLGTTSADDGRMLQSVLLNSLAETPGVRIIDPAARESLLREISFSLSGLSEEEEQLEAGRLTAAEVLILGDLGTTGDLVLLNLRSLDVETGVTLAAFSTSGGGLSDILQQKTAICAALTEPLRGE